MSDEREASAESWMSAIDEVVTSWPDVRGKNVFGHRGYVRRGRMFGFVAADGVAVKLGTRDLATLYEIDGVRAFRQNNKDMHAWPILPVLEESHVDRALDWLRRAYESAL